MLLHLGLESDPLCTNLSLASYFNLAYMKLAQKIGQLSKNWEH